MNAGHRDAEQDHLRWAGQQGNECIVGTASYAHTLMRVRTMSEKALTTRIKVIENAAGKHSVVKMKLFAQVLHLDGYSGLATKATQSYKRLLKRLGAPAVDDRHGV
jgi:hypothetical protein